MTLQDIAAGAAPVPLLQIGGDIPLSREIQTKLGELGVLDPPVDGQFGPVSQWALRQFLKQADLSAKTSLDAQVARALRDAKTDELFPLKTPNTLAGRLVASLRAKGHWISRHPDCVNIVYVEGMNDDGSPNGNTPNEFNDLRVVLRINRSGNPAILDQWEGTTEPGMFFTQTPESADGAARIAFGQYKSWVVGLHRKGSKSEHEALVQATPIDIFRDLDKNFSRAGDRKFTGIFGINQHWGFNLPKENIKNASAGCLVGRTKAGHVAFMTLCKSDARFQVSNGYRFMTAVVPAADV
jgi:peptidoglycan hydrolase-like protein with peptidoglycan-binding domain